MVNSLLMAPQLVSKGCVHLQSPRPMAPGYTAAWGGGQDPVPSRTQFRPLGLASLERMWSHISVPRDQAGWLRAHVSIIPYSHEGHTCVLGHKWGDGV